MPPSNTKVRDLNTIVDQLRPSISGRLASLDGQLESFNTRAKGVRQSLDTQRDNQFNRITELANRRGALFTGDVPFEQAQFIGESYLPSVANLEAGLVEARRDLTSRRGALEDDIYNKAFNIRETDRGRDFSRSERLESQDFQASRDQIARDFQAKENARDRGAANARAQAGLAASAQQAYLQDRRDILGELSGATGNDGKVSPESWNKLKNAWVGAGYQSNNFDQYFGQYRNASHLQLYE